MYALINMLNNRKTPSIIQNNTSSNSSIRFIMSYFMMQCLNNASIDIIKMLTSKKRIR